MFLGWKKNWQEVRQGVANTEKKLSKQWKGGKKEEVLSDSCCFLLCDVSVPPGEDHHPRGGRGPCAGGRRGLDPTARHRQNRPQEPGPDAHQRPSNVPHMPFSLCHFSAHAVDSLFWYFSNQIHAHCVCSLLYSYVSRPNALACSSRFTWRRVSVLKRNKQTSDQSQHMIRAWLSAIFCPTRRSRARWSHGRTRGRLTATAPAGPALTPSSPWSTWLKRSVLRCSSWASWPTPSSTSKRGVLAAEHTHPLFGAFCLKKKTC